MTETSYIVLHHALFHERYNLLHVIHPGFKVLHVTRISRRLPSLLSVHVRIEPWRIIARSRFVYTDNNFCSVTSEWSANPSSRVRAASLSLVSFLATSKRRHPREENKFAFQPISLVLERTVVSVHLYGRRNHRKSRGREKFHDKSFSADDRETTRSIISKIRA